jgi:hypothetical protein
MAEEPTYPTGIEYLSALAEGEDECAKVTESAIAGMGTKASQCYERLGTALSFLDRIASCYWACAGGDHTIEYLCGRAVGNGRTALRLAKFGLYDEALTLVRNIGELANLLFLFAWSPADLATWKGMSRRERMAVYRPAAVRIKLSKVETKLIPMGDEKHRLLSERAAHVTPDTRPQVHNVLGRPSLGGLFQAVGFLVCLNELALAISYVMFSAQKTSAN